MNVSFECRQCERVSRVEPHQQDWSWACPHCEAEYRGRETPAEDKPLDACLVCGCGELFVRKDFSQRLGVTIVVLGFLLSTIAWGFHMRYLTYGILFATALIDVALYVAVGNVLQCYRCSAEYRGLSGLEDHAAFNLETHERYRQQAARLAEQKVAGSSRS